MDSGWIDGLPFQYEAVRAPAAAHKTFLGHLYSEKSTVSANLLKVPEYERLPIYPSTINDRVQTICRFYRWAVDSEWLEGLPFHYEAVRAPAAAHKTFLGHLYCEKSTVSANLLKVPEYEQLPRPLRPDQIDAVFRCLPERLILFSTAIAPGELKRTINDWRMYGEDHTCTGERG